MGCFDLRYFTFRVHLGVTHQIKDSEEMKTFIRVNEILTDIYLCKVRLILFQGRIFSSSQLFLRCARPLWSTTGWTSRRTWRPRTRSPSGSTKSTLKVDRSRLLWWSYIYKQFCVGFQRRRQSLGENNRLARKQKTDGGVEGKGIQRLTILKKR